MQEKPCHLLSREELAARWGCSLRKVDRLRKYGELQWIDLTAKKGKRPVVRFHLDQIIQFEARCSMNTRTAEGGNN